MTLNQQKVGTDKRIKIYKSATKVSIMDINSALDYHREKDNEMIYRGNITFVINEYGKSKLQLQAFLPKATAKMVFTTIQNGTFMNIFPDGFRQYGGSIASKRARVLTIRFDPNNMRYMFQIEEGEGQPMRNGAIKMKNREKSVQTYVQLDMVLEMACEVIDFIRHSELISLMNDKPLYTYSTYEGNNRQGQNQYQNNQNNQYNQQQGGNNNPPQNNNFGGNQNFNQRQPPPANFNQQQPPNW